VANEHSLEVCVIDYTTGMLYIWNGSQTVNAYDAYEYTKCMLMGKSCNCFDAYMLADEKPSVEDFIASVREHVDGEDDEEVEEE